MLPQRNSLPDSPFVQLTISPFNQILVTCVRQRTNTCLTAGEQGRVVVDFEVPSLEECMRDTEQLGQIVKMAREQLREQLPGHAELPEPAQMMSLLKGILQNLSIHSEGESHPLTRDLPLIKICPCLLHLECMPCRCIWTSTGSYRDEVLLAGQQDHLLSVCCVSSH